jgi:DNA-binding transcriptional ArsR family regulator
MNGTTPELDYFRPIARNFKLLGDPMRLLILHSLKNGEMTVNEIVSLTGSSQPNISKHMAILHSAGLVNRRKSGTSVFFSIAAPFIFSLCDTVCSEAIDHTITR